MSERLLEDGSSKRKLEDGTSTRLLEDGATGGVVLQPFSGLIRTAQSMSIMPLKSLIAGG